MTMAERRGLDLLSRKGLALVAGMVAGIWLGNYVVADLESLPEWTDLVTQAPQAAAHLRYASLAPFPFVMSVLFTGLLTFFELHEVINPEKPHMHTLPPYPFDPTKTQLILGEEHEQNGDVSPNPKFRVLPEKGMTTGVLVTGATGSAKTSAAQYPFTAQLIRLHADDPERKLGGLVIDAKGNYADYVQQQCLAAGRGDDYYEVSLTSGVTYNIISRPDLDGPSLGGHVADMISNVQGENPAADPFWRTEARDLAAQVIRIVRLAKGREPTMVDLYRLATSTDLFNAWLELAEQRVNAGEADASEYQSLRFWLEAKQMTLDPKLKSSIAAGLNGVASLFDVKKIRDIFCPDPSRETFAGFDNLIAEGKIVCLKVPYSELKQVSQIVGTMVKLNFFDAVMNRLARAEANQGDLGRVVFFVADEYDGYVTQPGDGAFLAKCREAKCCTIIATQSYESLVAKLKNEHIAHQLLAQLRTKIWLCAEDNYTAKQAADLCGETEKEKVSRSRNENFDASFSHLDERFVSVNRGGLGEGTTVSVQREHLFPPRVFTWLKLNQAIVKIFDGTRVLPPRYLYLKPYYEDPNLSWFDSPAALGEEDEAA